MDRINSHNVLSKRMRSILAIKPRALNYSASFILLLVFFFSGYATTKEVSSQKQIRSEKTEFAFQLTFPDHWAIGFKLLHGQRLNQLIILSSKDGSSKVTGVWKSRARIVASTTSSSVSRTSPGQRSFTERLSAGPSRITDPTTASSQTAI